LRWALILREASASFITLGKREAAFIHKLAVSEKGEERGSTCAFQKNIGVYSAFKMQQRYKNYPAIEIFIVLKAPATKNLH